MEATQQAGAVIVVLALFGGVLYWLRNQGMARFSVKGLVAGPQRRMRSIERLPLTAQHSLHLIEVGGRSLLVAVSPGGCTFQDISGWRVEAEQQEAVR